MTKGVFRIGSRKSALATVQSRQIQSLLAQQGLACELVFMESSGDVDKTTPLYQMDTVEPGLFTKQLEVALLSQDIDIAVHSLKDLPTKQPPELIVGALPPRERSEDVLLSRPPSDLKKKWSPLALPRGATVGTSSLRREAQLLSCRPDLNIVPLRGNVPTRVEAVRSGKLDAVVLAGAGLFRLGLPLEDLVKLSLPGKPFVPAPGQGALAVEIRRDAPEVLVRALQKLHDPTTELETRIERKILRELEGGCTLPLGVRCRADLKTGQLEVAAFLGVLKERGAATKEWTQFPSFDIRDRSEEAVVEKTVAYFKRF